MKPLVFAIAVAIGAGTVATRPAIARADGSTALDCPSASEEGQRLRDKGKYRQARDLFLACARTSCPAVVRKDCAKWLAEMEDAMPTIVVDAQDPQGGDIADARVLLDGEEIAPRLDGKPIAVDPGEHVLRVEVAGRPPVNDPVVIRVGEKNRLVKIEVAAAKETTKPETTQPPPSQPPPQPQPPREERRGPPVVTYVLGAVGVVALGSFAYFGITSKNDLSNLRGSCAPFCGQDQLDSVKSRMLVADVSLGVGIVALGVAAVLFVTSSGHEAAATGSARAATPGSVSW